MFCPRFALISPCCRFCQLHIELSSPTFSISKCYLPYSHALFLIWFDYNYSPLSKFLKFSTKIIDFTFFICYYNLCKQAEVVELADAPDSKSGDGDIMRVQVPPSAPNKNKTNLDENSKFVLFFTRDYFGLKIKQ